MHSIDTIDALVLDWLIRSGYQATFSKLPSPNYAQAQAQLSFLSFRSSVIKLIKRGEIQGAIDLIESEYKDTDMDCFGPSQIDLSVDCFKNVKGPVDRFTCLFFLKLQNFIEFIRKRDTQAALNYVQGHLIPFCQANPSFELVLQDILGVLVYSDPESSPMSWCFERSRRYSALASLVNCSLYNSLIRVAPLETLLKQVYGVDALVKELNGFGNDLDDRKWSTIQTILNNRQENRKSFVKTIKNE